MTAQCPPQCPVHEWTPPVDRLNHLMTVKRMSLREIHATEPYSALSFGTLCRAAKGIYPDNAHDRAILGLPAKVSVEPCPKCGKVHLRKSKTCPDEVVKKAHVKRICGNCADWEDSGLAGAFKKICTSDKANENFDDIFYPNEGFGCRFFRRRKEGI